MEEEIVTQVKNITDSLVRISQQKVDDVKIQTAIILNELEEKSKQFALPSEYAEGYIDAICDIKDKLGIKNTVYELYRDTPITNEDNLK